MIGSLTHLLGVWDVTGIGQDKSAKLVKILHRPPPPVRRTEALKHSHITGTLAPIDTALIITFTPQTGRNKSKNEHADKHEAK